MSATATCKTGRNENNRLRVTHIRVEIALGAKAEVLPHLDRALSQFEEFCTMSQSVRSGLPFTVFVHASDGSLIKQPSIAATY